MGALLAFLAFHRSQTHPREVLIETIWPGIDPAAGRLNLRVALHSLRRHLEPPGVPKGAVLRADRASVMLDPDAVETDVEQFEAAIESAGRADTETEKSRRLEEAVDLYRGELLPGYYQDWVLTEQRRFADLYFESIRRLAAHHTKAQQWNAVLDLARRAVALDPLREEAHQDLIRLLATSGQPAAALQQYQELERVLREELETEPLEATRALVSKIQKEQQNESPVLSSTAPAQYGESPPAGRPSGTVTFLLIEPALRSSDTRAITSDAEFAKIKVEIKSLLPDHDGCLLRESCDSLTIAFQTAENALRCAVASQQTANSNHVKEAGRFPIRMALDTCDTKPAEREMRRRPQRRVAALVSAAHGGQILCSETTAVLARALGQPDFGLDDLGLFRLRGHRQPERLFSVIYPDMPPASPPPAAARARAGSLPPSLTMFVGRDEELATLQEILSERDVRLLTLTGPGGCGKTRLAVETARALMDSWRESIWFVPLEDLNNSSLVADAILDAMGEPRHTRRKKQDQLAQAFCRQPSLLLLDNFEHLVEGGAAVVRKLLEMVPDLKCLVSSRRRLNLDGEREFEVKPLPTPTPGDSPEALMRCPSVELFVDRAQAALPDFQVTDHNAPAVAGLCCRLEGIPLAIELAAARASAITPARMLAELEQRFDFLVSRRRDVPDRHKTMRTALEWSIKILSRELQRFLARLSVFRGGWTVEAAAVVCGQADAMSLLEQLRECSLVQADGGGSDAGGFRFRMLETLREFTDGKLDHRERHTLRQRHADYYLSLAEQTGPGFRGMKQKEWLAHLHREQENLRSALEFCLAMESQSDQGLRMAAALWPFWESRGSVSEGRSILAALLNKAKSTASSSTRSEALNAAGILAGDQGDFVAALRHFEESLEIHRGLENRQGTACVLGNLALVHKDQGEYERANSLFEESLKLQQELNNTAGIAASLANLGNLAMDRDDLPAALRFFEESLVLAKELGDNTGIAAALNNLASVHLARGDLAKSRPLLDEALALSREAGNRRWEAVHLHNLGRLAAAGKDGALSWACLSESLKIAADLGDQRAVASMLEQICAVLSRNEVQDTTAELLGAAAALREAIGAPRTPREQAEFDRVAEAVRAILDDEVYNSAWETGQAITPEEAIALALSLEPRATPQSAK